MGASECKIAALSNPLSGKNKRGGFVKFERVIKKFPLISYVVASDPKDIVAALQRFARENIGIIVLNGGDGTLQTVLTYLKYAQEDTYSPELLLLQAGTTSMAFGDVGCKGRLDKILTRVTRYADHDYQQLVKTQRPVLRMHLPSSNKTLCGMFFGAGAIYSGILYCRQKLHTKGMRGELGPSIAMLWFLLDWITTNKLTVPATARIRIDQTNEVSGEFNIIVATTLNRLLLGAYPFWASQGEDQNPALSLIKRNSPQAAKAFMRILRGRPPKVEQQADFYQSYYPNVIDLEIENGFTLDGELFGEQGVISKVRLEAAGAMSFLTT